MDISIEQKARNILEYLGIKNAQQFTAGDVLELAEIINKLYTARAEDEDQAGRECVMFVPVKKDFYARIKNFEELTGHSEAEILRRGAIKFINDWHFKKQESREAENRKIYE